MRRHSIPLAGPDDQLAAGPTARATSAAPRAAADVDVVRAVHGGEAPAPADRSLQLGGDEDGEAGHGEVEPGVEAAAEVRADHLGGRREVEVEAGLFGPEDGVVALIPDGVGVDP